MWPSRKGTGSWRPGTFGTPNTALVCLINEMPSSRYRKPYQKSFLYVLTPRRRRHRVSSGALCPASCCCTARQPSRLNVAKELLR